MRNLPQKLLLFLLIPILSIEIFVRIIPVFDRFYDKYVNAYSELSGTKGGSLCFIGTSRVAAAIVPDSISRVCSTKCINMGRGYTTAAIHYFGLNYALQQNPDCLRNASVFIEAPNGLCTYNTTWKDDWVDAQSPVQIIPYLNFRSLCNLWKQSNDTFGAKLKVTIYYFWKTLRFYEVAKEKMENYTLPEMLAKAGIVNKEGPAEGDMTGLGGIKSDTASVNFARAFAKEYYGTYEKNLAPVTENMWEKSIFNDIYELVSNAGGKLVLFEIPLSSVQKKAFSCKTATENIKVLNQYQDKHDIPTIKVSFNTTDSDFPDMWHISLDKACEFSHQLGKEINNFEGNTSSIENLTDKKNKS